MCVEASRNLRAIYFVVQAYCLLYHLDQSTCFSPFSFGENCLCSAMCTKRRNNREKANWNIRINFRCILTACNNACEEHRVSEGFFTVIKEIFNGKLCFYNSCLSWRNFCVVEGFFLHGLIMWLNIEVLKVLKQKKCSICLTYYEKN